MDIDNEFGDYMTETEIQYLDTGDKLVITSSWNELPPDAEIYEERVKYLFRLPERLSFCLTEEQKKYLQDKINKIPTEKLRDAALNLNARSYRVCEWMNKISLLIPDNYKVDGTKFFGEIVLELNKYISLETPETDD